MKSVPLVVVVLIVLGVALFWIIVHEQSARQEGEAQGPQDALVEGDQKPKDSHGHREITVETTVVSGQSKQETFISISAGSATVVVGQGKQELGARLATELAAVGWGDLEVVEAPSDGSLGKDQSTGQRTLILL